MFPAPSKTSSANKRHKGIIAGRGATNTKAKGHKRLSHFAVAQVKCVMEIAPCLSDEIIVISADAKVYVGNAAKANVYVGNDMSTVDVLLGE